MRLITKILYTLGPLKWHAVISVCIHDVLYNNRQFEHVTIGLTLYFSNNWINQERTKTLTLQIEDEDKRENP